MSVKLNIDPLTRVSGFLKIEVQVENNKIIDAKCTGSMFRGFELMLKGRNPLDVIYFTERICGICSTAHSYVSSQAMEKALGVEVPKLAMYIRDFIHGAEFLQNHLRHFYLYTLPDYVRGPKINPVYNDNLRDYRLPENIEQRINMNYIRALEMSSMAHQILALLAGKAPHNHGIFIGGVTSNLDANIIFTVEEKLKTISDFIEHNMLMDLHDIAEYYKDYFTKGSSGNNFLSYGLFDNYIEKDIFYLKPSVMIKGQLEAFNADYIDESINNSWYEKDPKGDITGNRNKEGAYSFVKTARYNGEAMEVGPLARMILSGEYKKGSASMDRIVCRVLEVNKIAMIMQNILKLIKESYISANSLEFKTYGIPNIAKGEALRDTTRGALGHWLSIENKTINTYNIITPSVWNLGPSESSKSLGIVEKALIGTTIENISSPVEVGRIVRSFDPCISCATHIYGNNFKDIEYNII